MILKKSFPCISIFLGILFFVTVAKSATIYDPMIGIRVGQVIMNKILASPPIPNIAPNRSKGKMHLSPQASYLGVQAENHEYGTEDYSGTLDGYAGGLGFTYESQEKLSLYGFTTYSVINGDIASSTGTKLTAMKNTGFSVSAGGSYRLAAGNNFAVGILGGPFITDQASEFNAIARNPGDSNGTFYEHEYSSKSFLYGAMAGLQAYWKISQFSINPYFLFYKDFSNPCRKFETTAPQEGRDWSASAKSCDALNQEIYIDGTFYAYGLILGLRNFSLGIYSDIQKDPELSSISTQSYSLSYAFSF